MNELISERELAKGDGWRIIAVEYWVYPGYTQEKVVLEPGPFAKARRLREAISLLLEWTYRLRDSQGPNFDMEGPAMKRLLHEWQERWKDPKIFKDIAEVMNRHIMELHESDPDAAKKWLDELEVSGLDRGIKGDWLTREHVRTLFKRWRERWSNTPPP